MPPLSAPFTVIVVIFPPAWMLPAPSFASAVEPSSAPVRTSFVILPPALIAPLPTPVPAMTAPVALSEFFTVTLPMFKNAATVPESSPAPPVIVCPIVTAPRLPAKTRPLDLPTPPVIDVLILSFEIVPFACTDPEPSRFPPRMASFVVRLAMLPPAKMVAEFFPASPPPNAESPWIFASLIAPMLPLVVMRPEFSPVPAQRLNAMVTLPMAARPLISPESLPTPPRISLVMVTFPIFPVALICPVLFPAPP